MCNPPFLQAGYGPAYALVKNTMSWLVFIKEILDNSGYSCVWEHPECVDPRDFLPELTDQYIQHWAEELQSSTGIDSLQNDQT